MAQTTTQTLPGRVFQTSGARMTTVTPMLTAPTLQRASPLPRSTASIHRLGEISRLANTERRLDYISSILGVQNIEDVQVRIGSQLP